MLPEKKTFFNIYLLQKLFLFLYVLQGTFSTKNLANPSHPLYSRLNVCDLILSKYDKLTKQTKTVADYILANQRETQYMSITTLADNCGVADATVYRLCRTLGFSGYNDFKLALVKGNGKRPLDMPLGLDGNVTMEDSIGDMSKKLYSVNASALADTLTRLDPKSIDKAVDTLKKARSVYCLGFGGSMVIAMEAVSRFATITNKFRQISDTHMQAMAIALSGPEDVILLFSFSGATRDIFDVLENAKKRGTKIILVTHFPKSPRCRLRQHHHHLRRRRRPHERRLYCR